VEVIVRFNLITFVPLQVWVIAAAMLFFWITFGLPGLVVFVVLAAAVRLPTWS
jgi:hypothetical protein